ncbi:MAG: hypothetical protein JXQ66_07470 [Campylobacterales bacterium]|nr:hypothetical protein [Campylobacterales bacterium]
MKKVYFCFSFILILSYSVGGVHNVKTLDYAKKNSLNEELYSNVSIIGVSENSIDKAEMLETLNKSTETYFDFYYASLCRKRSVALSFALGANNNEYENCMKYRKTSFINTYTEGIKTTFSIVTAISARHQIIQQDEIMHVYIDDNILSYKKGKSSNEFLNYNKKILKLAMEKSSNKWKNSEEWLNNIK